MYPLLTFITLFTLGFWFTISHQMFPASAFDARLFPWFFVAMLGFGILSGWASYCPKLPRWWQPVWVGLWVLVVCLMLGKTTYSAIWVRHLNPEYPVHDNPLQLEAGIDFLRQGKNPYTENYFGTPLENWHDWKDNPSLYHFITLPFYILFSLLISLPTKEMLGFFDERIVHVLVLGMTVFILGKLLPSWPKRLFYLTLFLYNPIFIHFFIEGRNDVFVFSWVALSLFLLSIKRFRWSVVALTLAIASKQSAWLFLPLYGFYLWLQGTTQNHSLQQRWRWFGYQILPGLALAAVLFIPFLVWDGPSFISDVYSYPAGTLPTSYEIKGYGFSPTFLRWGWVKSEFDYYPFGKWQLGLGLPLLGVLLIWLNKMPRLSLLTFSYAAFLGTFWLFFRFFNENYVGYLSMVFILGMVFYECEQSSPECFGNESNG